MRKTFNLGAASVVLLMALFASGAMAGSGHDLKPKFGGVVVETKVGDIEIMAKPESIQLTSSITVKLQSLMAVLPRSRCSMAQKNLRLIWLLLAISWRPKALLRLPKVLLWSHLLASQPRPLASG